MKFTLKLKGNSPEELAAMLNALTEGGVMATLPVRMNNDATEAEIDVDGSANKSPGKRGRPRKSSGTGVDTVADGPVQSSGGGHDGTVGFATRETFVNGNDVDGPYPEPATELPGTVCVAFKNDERATRTPTGNPADAADAASRTNTTKDSAVLDKQPDTPVASASQNVNAPVDLSPKEAIEKGLALMITAFGASPKDMGPIQRLQTKYGVRMFKDVPEQRALEFYADAKLIANGSPVV